MCVCERERETSGAIMYGVPTSDFRPVVRFITSESFFAVPKSCSSVGAFRVCGLGSRDGFFFVY